jgi:hypothetical protein
MALAFDDVRGVMVSSAACVIAFRCGGRCQRGRLGSAWHVSGHGGRVLTRNDAMTAMLLAELDATGAAEGPLAALYRQELGLV